MALLQLVVTLITCIAAVESAANVTSCTSLSNDQCWQNRTSCPLSPCSMFCGTASPQRSCIQECIVPRVRANQSEEFQCGALECQASKLCQQACSRVDCKSLTCTAGECFQECYVTSCGEMMCGRNVTNCTQSAWRAKNAQIMDCNAKSCRQDCGQDSDSFSSELTCSSAVETCNQSVQSGNFKLKCLPGVKNCVQKAKTFSVANMQCGADVCEQSCAYGTCSMSCSAGVRECVQVEDRLNAKHVTMNCNADECIQKCGYGRCNMTCSSNVKNCTQTCEQGTCFTRCDAETCHKDFGISTTALAPTSLLPTIRSDTSLKCSCVFITFCLVLISLVISTQ